MSSVHLIDHQLTLKPFNREPQVVDVIHRRGSGGREDVTLDNLSGIYM